MISERTDSLNSEIFRKRGMMEGLKILGLGSAIPSKRVHNDDLAKLVDTSDEWIYPRTGIHERRFAK